MNASEQRAVRREKGAARPVLGRDGPRAPSRCSCCCSAQSTGSLRVAVTLGVLTIVMLAVSVAMRPSVEMLRVEIEHRVLDELERVRVRSREDITTAARNTHRALTEKIQAVAETFDDVRHQIGELQASDDLLAKRRGRATGADLRVRPAAAPGVVRRTETVHVTRRTTTVDAGDDDGRHCLRVEGAVDGEWRERERDMGRCAGDALRPATSGRRPAPTNTASELRVGERRASRRNDDHATSTERGPVGRAAPRRTASPRPNTASPTGRRRSAR